MYINFITYLYIICCSAYYKGSDNYNVSIIALLWPSNNCKHTIDTSNHMNAILYTVCVYVTHQPCANGGPCAKNCAVDKILVQCYGFRRPLYTNNVFFSRCLLFYLCKWVHGTQIQVWRLKYCPHIFYTFTLWNMTINLRHLKIDNLDTCIDKLPHNFFQLTGYDRPFRRVLGLMPKETHSF